MTDRRPAEAGRSPSPDEALAELRRRLNDAHAQDGSTQEQLGRRAGLNRTTVNRTLSARGRIPTPLVVAHLAKALRLPVEPLLELLRTARPEAPQPLDPAGPADGTGPDTQPGTAAGQPIADDRVISELKHAFLALLRHARGLPFDKVRLMKRPTREALQQQNAAENAWDEPWQHLVDAARMAALEIRHATLRSLLIDGLRYLTDWRDLDYAFYRRSRAWVLESTVTHLCEAALTVHRGDPLPEPTPCYQQVQDAWELRQEELRIQHEEA
ncbi:helix-turn-helix domain-containing protein [Streptomyces sp. NPDC049597]|uniref:helix-turn-helix domain-containing protein n=1 Tax=Streptomyces sp. NPDC049597 TaxID=3155276 RepID=UPI003416445C